MATKKPARHKGPALTWRRPKDLNELWEAVAPGGGRYVIKMVGAYRTGATRYEVSLTGSSHYDNTHVGQARSADAAKRMAAAHSNRRTARMQAVAVGPTTRGPWDSAGGKRRKAAKAVWKKPGQSHHGAGRVLKGPPGWRIAWRDRVALHGGYDRYWSAHCDATGKTYSGYRSREAAMRLARRLSRGSSKRKTAGKASKLGAIVADINRLVK